MGGRLTRGTATSRTILVLWLCLLPVFRFIVEVDEVGAACHMTQRQGHVLPLLCGLECFFLKGKDGTILFAETMMMIDRMSCFRSNAALIVDWFNNIICSLMIICDAKFNKWSLHI